nr:hypothetical protein BaRGS_034627 [Batillaria attramentaria]
MTTDPNVTARTAGNGECLVVPMSDIEAQANQGQVITAHIQETLTRYRVLITAALCIVCMPANCLSCTVFFKQGLRKRMNLCLFVLSVSDLVSLLIQFAFNWDALYSILTSIQTTSMPLYKFLVNNNFLALVGFSSVSGFVSSVIALERCLCVAKPHLARTYMKTRTMAVVLLVAIVVILGAYWTASLGIQVTCVYDPTANVTMDALMPTKFQDTGMRVSIFGSLVFGVVLPGIFLPCTFIATIITVIKLRKVAAWRQRCSAAVTAKEIALTRMLIGSSVLFVVCMVPEVIARLVVLTDKEVMAGASKHHAFLLLIDIVMFCNVTNSSFNFFIYLYLGIRAHDPSMDSPGLYAIRLSRIPSQA